jgi:nitrite reductase/ring-hydroxylating ferredoxin subunit
MSAAPIAVGRPVEGEPHTVIARCPHKECRALHRFDIRFGLLVKPPCQRACVRILVQVGGAA